MYVCIAILYVYHHSLVCICGHVYVCVMHTNSLFLPSKVSKYEINNMLFIKKTLAKTDNRNKYTCTHIYVCSRSDRYSIIGVDLFLQERTCKQMITDCLTAKR